MEFPDVPNGVFSSVTAGYWYLCGLRTDGSVECWTGNDYGRPAPPEGSFSAVTAGAFHSWVVGHFAG